MINNNKKLLLYLLPSFLLILVRMMRMTLVGSIFYPFISIILINLIVALPLEGIKEDIKKTKNKFLKLLNVFMGSFISYYYLGNHLNRIIDVYFNSSNQFINISIILIFSYAGNHLRESYIKLFKKK